MGQNPEVFKILLTEKGQDKKTIKKKKHRIENYRKDLRDSK